MDSKSSTIAGWLTLLAIAAWSTVFLTLVIDSELAMRDKEGACIANHIKSGIERRDIWVESGECGVRIEAQTTPNPSSEAGASAVELRADHGQNQPHHEGK